MSNKQKSYLLITLIIVALVMIVSRTGRILINLEKLGYVDLKKAHEYVQSVTHTNLPDDGADMELYVSDTKLDIIEDLALQKDALEIKSLELEKRDLELQLVAIELENKLAVIREAEGRIMFLIEEQKRQNNENISHLVKLYTNMNSTDAARIIENLDTDTAALLLKSMDTDTASVIMSQINEEKIEEITHKFLNSTIQRK